MKKIFGLSTNGSLCDPPSNFVYKDAWVELTDYQDYNRNKLYTKFIKDHILWLFQRVLSSLIFGKSDPSRVSGQEDRSLGRLAPG